MKIALLSNIVFGVLGGLLLRFKLWGLLIGGGDVSSLQDKLEGVALTVAGLLVVYGFNVLLLKIYGLSNGELLRKSASNTFLVMGFSLVFFVPAIIFLYS